MPRTRPERRLRHCLPLLALCACDEAPPVPPPHPKHDIVIERGIVHYNKVALGPGVPLQRWIDRFGPPSRQELGWAYWDALGLTVGASTAKSQAAPNCVRLLFEPAIDGKKQRAFPGRVLLEGAPLYRDVHVNHVNRRMRLTCSQFPKSAHFAKSGLPGYYECKTDSPPRSYWLRVYVKDRELMASELELCCPEDRGCG